MPPLSRPAASRDASGEKARHAAPTGSSARCTGVRRGPCCQSSNCLSAPALAHTSGRRGCGSTARASAKCPEVSSWLEPVGAASFPVRDGAHTHRLHRAVPTSSRGRVRPASLLFTGGAAPPAPGRPPAPPEAETPAGVDPAAAGFKGVTTSAKRTPLLSSSVAAATPSRRASPGSPPPPAARPPGAVLGWARAVGKTASERMAPAPPTSDEPSAAAAETAV
eukprot:scaffold24422_cov112-Isochrysis_galbana.AAC.1